MFLIVSAYNSKFLQSPQIYHMLIPIYFLNNSEFFNKPQYYPYFSITMFELFPLQVSTYYVLLF